MKNEHLKRSNIFIIIIVTNTQKQQLTNILFEIKITNIVHIYFSNYTNINNHDPLEIFAHELYIVGVSFTNFPRTQNIGMLSISAPGPPSAEW